MLLQCKVFLALLADCATEQRTEKLCIKVAKRDKDVMMRLGDFMPRYGYLHARHFFKWNNIPSYIPIYFREMVIRLYACSLYNVHKSKKSFSSKL